VVADKHSLLEKCRVWAGVAELATQAIAHVVHLAARLHIRIISGWTSGAGEGCLLYQQRGRIRFWDGILSLQGIIIIIIISIKKIIFIFNYYNL